MSDPSVVSLVDVLDFREGPGIMAVDFREGGVPLIRLAGLKAGAHLLDGCNYLDPDKVAAKWGHFRVAQGDVLLSTSASLGEVAVVGPDGVGAVPYTGIIRFRPKDSRVAAEFIQYALRSGDFKQQIVEMGVGSVMNHFGPSHLKHMTLRLPSVEQQRAIAEVLGALDDKIAANAKLVATVDDLLASRFAALAAGSASAVLGAIAEVNVASAKPTEGGSLRYLDIASVGVGSYDFPEIIGWDEAPGRARRILRLGDTVWSTVRPNRRSHALVLDDDPLLIASTGLAVLTPKLGQFAFVYEATRTPQFTAYLEAAAEGSAYPAVRADRFLAAPVPDVGVRARQDFESLAAPLRRRVHSSAVESRTLAEMRDALLPQLMSGKIRVRDAERVVEGVV